ncbi:hypothetical protein ALGA_4195 [Labilibaculum antarcticum]|uniref:Uncharacterized protein n=1 Tax=Labilibaculum antarcticum TaxID=1717717 RepID=A0A1Y1CPX0_9BACT|nr:hypothetical protein ALGA_4195 [Labilibaculum antarcticum]
MCSLNRFYYNVIKLVIVYICDVNLKESLVKSSLVADELHKSIGVNEACDLAMELYSIVKFKLND